MVDVLRNKITRAHDMKVEAHASDVARVSRPLWRGHPFAALRAGSACALIDLAFSFDLAFFHDVETSLARERDAPATAGGTPALRPLSPKDLTFMSRTQITTPD